MSQETFLLVCRDCAEAEQRRGFDPKDLPAVLTKVFSNITERGRWATEHERRTGHDRWWIKDVTR